MRLLVNRLGKSPVLMSWGNLVVKSSSLVLLLPLVLGTLEARDSVIWFAVATLFSFQMMVDFGLTPTTTRFVSYAFGGLGLHELLARRVNAQASQAGTDANWRAITFLSGSLRSVYRLVAVVALCLGGVLSALTLGPAILRSSAPASAMAAVTLVVLVATITTYSNTYVSVLQGCGRLAAVQRIQMVFSLVGMLCGAVLLLSTRSVAWAICGYYGPNVAAVLMLRKRCYELVRVPPTEDDSERHKELGRRVRWRMAQDAAKSGVGVLLSQGVVQLSGLWVTRTMSAEVAASYMLAVQLIRAVSSFSQVPLYAHLPRMASLYASVGRRIELLHVAAAGMIRSLAVFLVLMVAVAIGVMLAGRYLVAHQLPSLRLWGLLGLAFLAERFGAMQLQLYTLSGDVLWHYANAVAALIALVSAPLTFRYLGVDGLALSLLIGYSLFYVPFCTAKARAIFRVPLVRPSVLLVAGLGLSALMIVHG